jgi:hypothetical protein
MTGRRALIMGGMAAALLPRMGLAQAAPGKVPRPEVSFRVPEMNEGVAGLVAQVDPARLRADVEALAGFGTRWSEGPGYGAVEDWMEGAFGLAGPGGAIARQPVTLPAGMLRNNVIWGDPLDGREVILLGAHLDTISEDPALSAPGANDNGSGIAAMLEALRILSGQGFARQIVCVGFTGEEQGLIGSARCAALATQQRWPVELMVNLDMLGYRPPDPAAPLFIEYDQGNGTGANDAAAAAYGRMAVALADQHVTLTTAETDIWDSDYMPFEAAGFPCIGLYDGGADGPAYHSSGDVPELMDFDRLEQATRLLVAIMATAAELA